MLRAIHLHGRLGKRFGRRFDLAVSSPTEAIRALIFMVPGFSEYIRHRGYVVSIGEGTVLDREALDLQLGRQTDIHITPAGAVSGIVTILLGATLLITAASSIAVLSMPKVPTAASREESTKTASYIFDGAENVTEQGHPVPLVYGRFRVGSIVGSAGITTSDANEASVSADPSNPYLGGGSGYSGYVGSTPGIRGSVYGDEWVQLQKGGGKGGGGSTRAAQEDPNSLQSQATAKVLDIVSEGEIVGLVDGMKSIYFDDTPLQNPDGSFNFAGVAIEQRVGLPDQDFIPGFGQNENSVEINTQVRVALGPVTRTVQNRNATVARVTIRLPQLYQQDTTNGDLKASSVTIKISVQADGGGFTDVLTKTFTGKTNSGYQWSTDVRLPNGAQRDIRVTRITPDSEVASLSNETHWDLLTEVVEAKLSYPDTAVFGLTVDARQFGASVPARSYDIKGLIVEVPSNYDPVARTYTGVWDGTWKRAWTDNPAWVFRDIIVNRRYGLGARVPVENVDKWGLYAIAQHCDGMIPDGFGGMRPRYTINISIKNPAAAYDVLASIASNFRGFAYWGSGAVVAVQDRPEDPSILITPANVIDGKISYSRITPIEKRRSVAVVYWNDPEDGYRLTPEIVEDPDLIKRFGRRGDSGDDAVTAFGVTNRGQAHTMCRWLLEDEAPGSNAAATYEVGDDHGFVEPGRVAEVADPMFTQSRRGGRVRAATPAGLTIDAPYTFVAGQNYRLRVTLPDGTVSVRAITNAAGAATALTLGGANWATPPNPGAVWTIETDQVANRQFRVRSISTDEPPFAVRAVLHDPTKWDRVELDRDISTPNFIELPTGPLKAPDNIDVFEFLMRDGDAAIPCAQVSWRGNDSRITFYQAQSKAPGQNWEPFADSIDVSRIVRGVQPGPWGFRVRGLDSLGRKTEWVEATFDMDAQVDSLPNVTGLMVVPDNDALTSMLIWVKPNDRRPLRYRVLFSDSGNIANAIELATVDTQEWVVSKVGTYWVQTQFLQVLGANPPAIVITQGDLPAVIYDRVVDAPRNLHDLDPGAADAISGLQGDYDAVAAAAAAAAALAASVQQAQQELESAQADLADATARAQADAASALAEAAGVAAGLSAEVDRAKAEAAGLRTDVASVTSGLADEVTRAKADTASIRTVQVQMQTDISGNASRISTEETNRATADSALANRALELESTVNTGPNSNAALRSNLTDEATTRASADAAIAARTVVLETTAGKLATNYTACAAGLQAYQGGNVPGNRVGLYDGAGQLVAWHSRSYIVVLFAADDTVLEHRRFDVYGGSDAASMADYLNAQPSGRGVAVISFDEPREYRLTGGLVEAMTRCGAGDDFLSPSFAANSAYILLGYAGAGRNGGEEFYRGDIPQDYSAWLQQPFAVLNGIPQISSGRRTAAVNARVSTEEVARAAADSAIAARTAELEATVNTGPNNSTALRASIVDEAAVRASADGALATRAESLEAKVGGVDVPGLVARVGAEEIARANADGALAGRADTLEATVNTGPNSNAALRASVTDETAARASADAALAIRASALEARAGKTPVSYVAVVAGSVAASQGPLPADIYPFGVNDAAGLSISGANRSYTVTTFAANSSVAAVRHFDVYGDGEQQLNPGGPAANGGAAMRDYLNALALGTGVVVTTFDEPQRYRLANGLQAAMERCGAGDLYASPSFKIHSAYMLLGYAGVGRAGGQEFYKGDVDSVNSSWFVEPFSVLNGRPMLASGRNAAEVNARVGLEEVARAAADSALASRSETLEATVNSGPNSNASLRSGITEEAAARASADGALATRAATLEAQFRGDFESPLFARLRAEETARADGDSALATRATSLEAKAQRAPVSYLAAVCGNVARVSGGLPDDLRGLYDGVGQLIAAGSRSYMVVTFTAGSGVAAIRYFDVYGEGAIEYNPGGPSANNAAAMAAYLNNLPKGTGVVVLSDDEPREFRLTGGLPAAMERCGAGDMFTSSSFKGWGAYILLGYAGAQRSGGQEFYKGAIDQDTEAWMRQPFSVLLGRPIQTSDRQSAQINARVGTEEAARVAADSALATRTAQLEATVNTGPNSNAAVRASITDEATTRAAADSALAARSVVLEAKAARTGADYTVVAAGNQAWLGGNVPGNLRGLYDGAGAQITDYSRGYTVLQFGADNAYLTGAIFDTYGSAAAAQAMADYLNNIPSGRGVVITSFDEPFTNRMEGGLPAAIYRCGGGTMFESGGPNGFFGNGAYMLLGYAGAGRGGGFEAYKGDYGQDPSAWIVQAFTVVGGRPATANQMLANKVNARVSTEEAARVAADSALATRTLTLENQFKGDFDSPLFARLRTEETARSSADAALATRATTLEAKAVVTPTAYIIRCRGGSAGGFGPEGLWRAGTAIAGVGRSYTVAYKYLNSEGWEARVFDVYGAGAIGYNPGGPSANDAGGMAAYLNSIPDGAIVVVMTADEPQANRLTGGLQAAMERCGAGPMFSSPAFQYRSAYALVGKAGAGYGSGNEYYAGQSYADTGARIEQAFGALGDVLLTGDTATHQRNLTARLVSTEGVVAGIDGRTQAYWAVSANAGGTSASIEARATSNPDGSTSSRVGVVAEEFSVTNTSAGIRRKVLSVIGQEVLINGNLAASAGVFLGSGAKWAYQLQTKTFAVSDGTVVAFGVDLGRIPAIDFSTIGLAALAQDETYKLYADNLTSTGFTARLRISTPGAASAYNLTQSTAPGSGPTRQIARGSNPQANSGNYTFLIGGTYTGYAYDSNEPLR